MDKQDILARLREHEAALKAQGGRRLPNDLRDRHPQLPWILRMQSTAEAGRLP